MASLHFYITFYCAVNLAVLSETGVNGDKILDMIKSMKDEVILSFPSVKSIELSIEPPLNGYAFHNITREIDVADKNPFQDRGTNVYLYSKYFEGAPRDRLDFDGRGIANLTSRAEHYSSLDIFPLKPGTYYFGYHIKERFETLSRTWKVFSVPTYSMKPGAFFKHELDWLTFQNDSSAQSSNLKDIEVRVGANGGSPKIFGFANNIKNNTILRIKMNLADSSAYTLKVRLRDHPRQTYEYYHREYCTLCPCLKNIKLWIKDSDRALQNKEKFVECAAEFFWEDITFFIGVKCEDYGIDATLCEAQPLIEYHTPKQIDCIIEKIEINNQNKTSKCPYDVIGYDFSFTTSLAKSKTKWPPAPRCQLRLNYHD